MTLPHFFYKTATAAATAAALLAAPLALSLAPTTAVFAAAAPTAADQALATGTYSVDKPHTDISFTVTHMAITKVHGRFDNFDGKVKVDGRKPENSSVDFTIKVASIDTGTAQRDAHLKTKEFFDAATYPDITFKSTKIARKGEGFVAAGNLTIHGVTKAVTLPFTVIGPVKGMEGGSHLGISTSLTLKRSAYGMTSYPTVVGDDIAINIDLDLIKDGSIPAKPAAAAK